MKLKTALTTLVRSDFATESQKTKINEILKDSDLTQRIQDLLDIDGMNLDNEEDDEDEDNFGPSDDDLDEIETERVGGIEGGEPGGVFETEQGVTIMPPSNVGDIKKTTPYGRYLSGKGVLDEYESHLLDSKASLIQDLVKLADSLDKSELHQEADVVDNLIQKISK